jgi:disulfide bond formation protein DsbB
VAGLEPCTLCWYQRIAMYPLALILGIAAWRSEWAVRRYAAPLAVIGALIAGYHVVLQRVPSLPSTGCSVTAPCSAIDLERFGFVTIPFMALAAFAAILTVLFALAPETAES